MSVTDWRQLDAARKLALRDGLLQRLERDTPQTWYCTRDECDGMPHDSMPTRHARTKQRPPSGDWGTWLVLAGRGFGKTLTGAKWVHEHAIELHPRGALIAPTAGDARDVMIEGETGLLATAPRGRRPKYEPSKRRVTWPNGAVATVFSADEPERLRGPQHGWAWCDELAAWARLAAAWDNLQLGLRLGQHPRVMATTTPKPLRALRELIAETDTHVTRGSTYENVGNLAPSFRERILRKYEGTRLGRQELHAELLEDVEGALWTWAMIDDARVPRVDRDTLERIVVAVDPAVTSNASSDETGIVAVGKRGEHAFVLRDASMRGTPLEWATAAVELYHELGADALVAETNNGGDLVQTVIRQLDRTVRFRSVTASRGKQSRAEPVVALYEQQRVHHATVMPELEEQLTTWTVDAKTSPDRMDALVWGVSELLLRARRGVVTVA